MLSTPVRNSSAGMPVAVRAIVPLPHDPVRFHPDGRPVAIGVVRTVPQAAVASVVVVGGHRLVAESVAAAISLHAEHAQVRCVASLRALSALPGIPGSVLIVGEAPDGSVTELVRAARTRWARASIVILVDGSDRDGVVGLIRAGADGIVPPGAGVDHFLALVERSRRGEPLLPLPVIRRLGVQLTVAGHTGAPVFCRSLS